MRAERSRGRRLALVVVLTLTVLASCGGGGNHAGAPNGGAAGGQGGGQGAGDNDSQTNGSSRSASTDLTMSVTGHGSDHTRTDTQYGFTETSMTIDWSVTVTGSQDDIISGKALPKLTVSGTSSWKGSSDHGILSCSAGLHAAPNIPQSDLQLLLFLEPPGDPNPSPNYNMGVGPANTVGSKDYLVEAALPGKQVVSDNTNPAESQCNTGPAYHLPSPDQGTPQFQQYAKAAFPVARVHPDGSVSDASSSFAYSGPVSSPPGSTTTEEESLSTAISWGGCRVDHGASSSAFRPGDAQRVELTAFEADRGTVCPVITWVNAPGGPRVVGRTEAVQAGEPIELEADVSGGLAANSDGISWSINGRVVKDYVITDGNAHEVPLGDDDRARPDIRFFWTSAGGAGTSGAGAARSSDQTVRVTVNGQSATATFKVTTPEWKEFHANTCPAGIDTDPSIIERQPNTSAATRLPIFGLGFVNLPSRLCEHTPGITWRFEVIASGKMAMTQLIQDQMYRNQKPCATKTPSNGYGADNSKFYGGEHNTGSYTTNDSPGFSLNGASGTYERRFSARDYVMYRPEKPGSIWVPLAYMDWNFSETVTSSLFGPWKVVAKHDPLDKIDGVNWDEEPTWTWADTNANGFNCG